MASGIYQNQWIVNKCQWRDAHTFNTLLQQNNNNDDDILLLSRLAAYLLNLMSSFMPDCSAMANLILPPDRTIFHKMST